MRKGWLSVALFRVFLPIVLTGCTAWRPVGLSLVYLGLTLYSPNVPIPNRKTMIGHTGHYLKTCIGLSFLTIISQITFHIVLLALPPYGHFLQNCEFLEQLFRHMGFVRLDSASPWEIFFWLAPELIVLPSTIAIYLICRFLNQNSVNDEEESTSLHQQTKSSLKNYEETINKTINFLGHIGTYVVLASLCWIATVKPSVEGAFYFLVFLGAGTWWACNKELRKGFAVVCRIVMFVVAVHILVLLSYQNQLPQKLLPVDSIWARFFALEVIYETNCSHPRYVEYTKGADWLVYGYSLGLFWLYYVLALQSQFLSKKPAKKVKRLSGKLENLDTPLSRHVSIRRRTPSQRWQSARRKARKPIVKSSFPPVDERTPLMRFGSGRTGLLQDSTGSVIVQDGHQDDSIQMQSLTEGDTDERMGIIEHIATAVYSIFQLVIRSSYLATNILMMAWSIMYHSWTTFALLLWALILWMVPNKRSSMMKCSPFIVFYVTLLLLVQYVYNMNLTEDELPTKVKGIDMSEIGFDNGKELSEWHLLVKCLFMAMFWITMRQYTAERSLQRRSSTLRDMVAPLHVSVSTATTAMSHDAPEIKSKFIKDVGKVLKKFLTKFWIANVAIMLFICGITGERMTVFRIIYMSLFLFLVVTLQISWSAWRRMIYGFWITVIGYSVIMLILVYTYQFENFPQYWSYLHIDGDLQMDIGLEKYATKDLFVKLLTPTFFVIITVVQIHYFHHDFLQATNIENLGTEEGLERASLGHASSIDMTISSPGGLHLSENDSVYNVYTLRQLKEMSKLERIAFFQNIMRHLMHFYNYTWLFLEIHMQKVIFTSIILLCVNDVCAIHFLFVIAVVIMINFKSNVQIMFINIMAAIIAILMVIKMLYQIQYIHHKNWNVNCTRNMEESWQEFSSNNSVYNIAEWIGMRKAEPGKLAALLKGYIGLIIVTTFRKINKIRQWFHRHQNGKSIDTPQVMFPSITRANADDGIVHCLKFLFNYGFYKFGLEFCLISIVTLIGTRLDFYSLLYAAWLLLLFSLKRRTVARIWPILRIFSTILLPVQYALVVAPPTWFCIEFPWNHSIILRRLQDWMYLPDPDFPPDPRKLICDFIVLFMIERQSLVFRIEKKATSTGTEFVGGHNSSVYQNMDNPNFKNPIKDYVSHIHSWLDIVKRAGMMSLMWITLSIMFLAGTKRTSLFSLGYLIGAFVFLWQGSDFYLRPVKIISRWWNLLIGYNIFVIFAKTLFQGVECVLTEQLRNSACWSIQLLGLACLKKFRSSTDDIVVDKVDCEVPREDIGMVWDGLCFAFLLFQKRLFNSYYFFHIVDETKAMSILASRGAELLEELHTKQIDYQENVEKTVLQNLKFKMDKIKANQIKTHGPSYKEPQTHKIDSLYPGTRPLYRHRAPKTNREAIRSGDYYMFDDLDDDDLTDLRLESELAKKEKFTDKRPRRMTVAELMNTLLKTDIDIATHVAMYGGTQKDALKLRRQSEPLTRKKSSMSYLSARSETETAAATDDADETSPTSADIEKEEKDTTKSAEPSDDEQGEEDGKKSEKDKEDRKKVAISIYFEFILVVVNSSLMTMTKFVNQFSTDYRYIRKLLVKEKKLLKATPDFKMGTRLGISQMWQPIPMMNERSTTNGNSEEPSDPGEGPSQPRAKDAKKRSSATVPHIRILAPSLERGLDMSSSSTLFSQTSLVDPDDEAAELSEVDQPPIIQLAVSLWFGILAHSGLLCYLMVFLHQIKNASVLSTPLPLMVFFWGSLTIPRPSKTFWVTLIAYTEAIVIIKCIFQLELIPWNQNAAPNNPFFIPRIMGVEKKQNYAMWDLLLLLMLFFHRFMLKSLGQWKTHYLKPRKVVPSHISLVSTKPPATDEDQGEPTTQEQQTSATNNTDADKKTSKESSLKVRSIDDGENILHTTDDNERLVSVQGEETDANVKEFHKNVDVAIDKYAQPMKKFFQNILNPVGKEKTNVYAHMFLCDFFNFILLIFGFSSFGTQQGDGGIAAYFEENRVPMPFLLMLLLQFTLMVIDRALFLKKSIGGKLIFQYCLIFGVHLWMFFILPSATERQFNEKLPPQIWYMVKCFYLLLAAYQLRRGYPTRILGNFLCKNYSMVNYVLFKGFMLVPFLFELRAVMDWIWTDTSMTIMDWFKMEDIFASIYQIKCMRGLEVDFPQPRGVKKKQLSKYLVGGGALFLIIGLIWFPLLLFALGSTVGVSNLPYDVSMKIKIGPYEPIFWVSAQSNSIIKYDADQYKAFTNLYTKHKPAITFLENYMESDVVAVRLGAFSKKLWDITPPDLERLKIELEDRSSTVTIHVEWTVSRNTDAKDSSGITTVRDIKLFPFVNGEFNPIRKSLANIVSGNEVNNSSDAIILESAFPKFLKVTSRKTNVVRQLMWTPHLPPSLFEEEENEEFDSYLYRNISLHLSTDTECCARQKWWVVQEICDDYLYDFRLKYVPLNNCKSVMMFLFNDKAFPEGLSFISGYGILGLYTTAVIVISQMMRKIVSDMAPKIMFDDLPYVDRILRLCLDIYLVRESGDLCLEEDLFAKLIFLYRSPETLIRWTRPPEEGERTDNEDQEENNEDGE